MRVWTSGEIEGDIDDTFRSARKDVEHTLNASVETEDYGAGVSKWALIYIILKEEDANYPEVQHYTQRTGVVEFRLKVDHRAFTEGNALSHRKLFAAAVIRSIDLCGQLRIANFDAVRFKADVLRALKNYEWV